MGKPCKQRSQHLKACLLNSENTVVLQTNTLVSTSHWYFYGIISCSCTSHISYIYQLQVWKPTNLGGTRWLPHLQRALVTLLKNYKPLLQHMEHTIQAKASSADMLGRARNLVDTLTDFRLLLFVHLVLDILDTLSRYMP